MSDEQPGQELEVREGRALDPVEAWISEHGYGTFRTLEDGRRILQLDAQLRQQCILAGPVTDLIQTDRNWTPQLRPFRVDVNDPQQAFKVGSVKEGSDWIDVMDLAAPAWLRLGELCGIQYVRSIWERWEGGMKVTVVAQKRGPDGNWIRAVASTDYEYAVEAELLEIDIMEKYEKSLGKDWEKPRPTELDIRKQVLRQRVFAGRTIETKSKARCVKSLTGLRQFRKNVLASKPILGIAWLMSADMNDPGSRELVRMQYAESIADLYGPDERVPMGTTFTDLALNPGAEIPGDIILDARDGGDEDPPPGVDPETGEIVEQASKPPEPEEVPGVDATPADEEPDWDEPKAEQEQLAIEKPEAFTVRNGPFAGESIERIVHTPAGRKWAVEIYSKLKTEGKREQMLDWLSWQQQRQITAENLKSVK